MDNDGRIFFNNNNFFHDQFMIPLGRILQVSELSVVRGGEISEHNQVCEELTYVISGSGKFYCNDEYITVSEGQFHFIKENNRHYISVSDEENLRYICIGIKLDKENESVKKLLNSMGRSQHVAGEDNGIIKGLTEYIVREFYSWDQNSIEMVNSYMFQTIVSLQRIISGNAIPYQKKNEKNSSSYVLYRMLRYLDREYMQIKSVSSIADKLSYSEYYLSHLFRRKMGITIKEYLTKKKVARGMELLTTTQLPVEKIAASLCFESSHSFRRTFKQYTGVSPTEYREKND